MRTEDALIETKNKIYDVLNELNEIHLILDTSYNSSQDLFSITSQETLLLIEQILVDTRKNLLKAKKKLQDIESSDDKIEVRIIFLFYSLIKLLSKYSNILNRRCIIIYKFLIVEKVSLSDKYHLYQNKGNITNIKNQLEKIKFQFEAAIQKFKMNKPSEKKFYLIEDNLKKGPFSPLELMRKNINGSTLILNESNNKWVPASEIEEIMSLLEVNPPPINMTTSMDTKGIINGTPNKEENNILIQTSENSDNQIKKKSLNNSSSAPPLQKSGIKILVGEQLENISVYRLQV